LKLKYPSGYYYVDYLILSPKKRAHF